jgi:predicted enzyme related to lactoylglutathione lyase
VAEAGGEQVADRQELEGVGSFAYFKDTEGNIFGAMQSAQRRTSAA